MCNLCSIVSNREAIIQFVKATNAKIGNLPPLPGIYPDYLAPIVILNSHGELEIVHRTAIKYLPGVEDVPSGDPLRMSIAKPNPAKPALPSKPKSQGELF